jgi:hypothetical protein
MQVRQTIYELLEPAESMTLQDQLVRMSELDEQLAQELGPSLTSHHYVGYFVVDRSQRIIASSHPALVGQQQIEEYESWLSTALDGQAIVCPPFSSVVMLEDNSGRERMGEPTMYVCAPFRDARYQVVAALALQIRPERHFTEILQLGRMGESGETYAFDTKGVMVSNSRFDDDLFLLGILPDTDRARSVLNVLIRDPGGNVTEGFRPAVRRSQMPLTKMAANAISMAADETSGNSNVDVGGYRDYRAVPVVGAWIGMPTYDIGVVTEVDVAEAFRPLTILQRTFWVLYSLLVVSSIAICAFTLVVARLQRERQKAVIEARQLGQYKLTRRIGAGAMGVVFEGQHAMLRRPTAIKMLDVDKVNDASIERFEREVQITCQLNNPNTISIYDFGRTPEGVFYFAMEYLDGVDLQVLVEKYGPQPEQRVIHILRKVCGSLYEAHAHGLVHRDIKPANIMLNRRGGEPDVVKVLDFGLVKAIDEEKSGGGNADNSLTGTPLYMSPEAIQTPMSVDPRSDIYAVGAVGYFLLTGEPVFDAAGLSELCQKHVDEAPMEPSKCLGKEISAVLENTLLACLEKARAKRPQTARDLAHMLEECPAANAWSINDGDAWWGRHERGETETRSDVGLDRTIVSSATSSG